MFRQQFRKVHFVNRNLTAPQLGYFLLVVIDREYFVSKLGETTFRYQAYVSDPITAIFTASPSIAKARL